MGITIKLEDEFGREIQSVGDLANELHRALPQPGATGFQWATTIDWYGDTVFNRMQAKLLRKEWAILIQNAANEKAKELLEQIDELLRRCSSEDLLYVKFYGD